MVDLPDLRPARVQGMTLNIESVGPLGPLDWPAALRIYHPEPIVPCFDINQPPPFLTITLSTISENVLVDKKTYLANLDLHHASRITASSPTSLAHQHCRVLGPRPEEPFERAQDKTGKQVEQPQLSSPQPRRLGHDLQP